MADMRRCIGSAKFGIEALPQNQKRAQLVWRAFRSGTISATNLWE